MVEATTVSLPSQDAEDEHQGWPYRCDSPEGVLRPGGSLHTLTDAVLLEPAGYLEYCTSVSSSVGGEGPAS